MDQLRFIQFGAMKPHLCLSYLALRHLEWTPKEFLKRHFHTGFGRLERIIGDALAHKTNLPRFVVSTMLANLRKTLKRTGLQHFGNRDSFIKTSSAPYHRLHAACMADFMAEPDEATLLKWKRSFSRRVTQQRQMDPGRASFIKFHEKTHRLVHAIIHKRSCYPDNHHNLSQVVFTALWYLWDGTRPGDLPLKRITRYACSDDNARERRIQRRFFDTPMDGEFLDSYLDVTQPDPLEHIYRRDVDLSMEILDRALHSKKKPWIILAYLFHDFLGWGQGEIHVQWRDKTLRQIADDFFNQYERDNALPGDALRAQRRGFSARLSHPWHESGTSRINIGLAPHCPLPQGEVQIDRIYRDDDPAYQPDIIGQWINGMRNHLLVSIGKDPNSRLHDWLHIPDKPIRPDLHSLYAKRRRLQLRIAENKIAIEFPDEKTSKPKGPGKPPKGGGNKANGRRKPSKPANQATRPGATTRDGRGKSDGNVQGKDRKPVKKRGKN